MLIDLYGVLSHEGEVKRLAAPIEAESKLDKPLYRRQLIFPAHISHIHSM